MLRFIPTKVRYQYFFYFDLTDEVFSLTRNWLRFLNSKVAVLNLERANLERANLLGTNLFENKKRIIEKLEPNLWHWKMFINWEYYFLKEGMK
ncbi:MAG: hypothetical protein K1X72_08185 [Pyrinomonadaceae bacterium]|nr:hypothetical protein [Pyrinomonadaceae bacterium]